MGAQYDPETLGVLERPSDQYLVDAAIDCLREPDFLERYVTLETAYEQQALLEVARRMEIDANKAARAAVVSQAAGRLGLSVVEAKRLGPEWHETVRLTGATVVDTSGTTLKQRLLREELGVLATSFVVWAKQQLAASQLTSARESATAQMTGVVAELDRRKHEPEFKVATQAWANSPTSQKDKGPNQWGYNAGIIHFFEYRSDLDKRRRFRSFTEPMTVDGFIEFTSRYKAELDQCGSSTANREAVLRDSEGHLRFGILTPAMDFVVGFQRAGSPGPRITSVIADYTHRDFDKVIATSLAGQDRGVLNKLGPVVERVL